MSRIFHEGILKVLGDDFIFLGGDAQKYRYVCVNVRQLANLRLMYIFTNILLLNKKMKSEGQRLLCLVWQQKSEKSQASGQPKLQCEFEVSLASKTLSEKVKRKKKTRKIKTRGHTHNSCWGGKNNPASIWAHRYF